MSEIFIVSHFDADVPVIGVFSTFEKADAAVRYYGEQEFGILKETGDMAKIDENCWIYERDMEITRTEMDTYLV